eukprot:7805150-Pyramimonas_sp.AAC.1
MVGATDGESVKSSNPAVMQTCFLPKQQIEDQPKEMAQLIMRAMRPHIGPLHKSLQSQVDKLSSQFDHVVGDIERHTADIATSRKQMDELRKELSS